MVTPSEGSVVLVRFPFSDLSSSKLRPAVVLAFTGRDDWILCQVTSNPYSDPTAIRINESDFGIGSLQKV
ncbi:MAG: MazF family transcriptional regulator, partial [Proteobacteria bacterium]|nr:MazF family transcriptional regulator [Pseudomonadota bacterium]